MNRTTRGVWALTQIMALALLAVTLNLNPAHASPDSTIFFDDFTGSGYPTGWTFTSTDDSGIRYPLQEQIQQGQGILSAGMYINAGATVALRAIQNTTDPIIGPNTKDGQYIYIRWQVQPFNLTSRRDLSQQIEFNLGLRNCMPVTQVTVPCNSIIAWKMAGSNYQSGTTAKILLPAFTIDHPMVSANNCLDDQVLLFQIDSACPASPAAPRYGDLRNQPFNPTRSHTFTISARFFPVTKVGSWIAYNIDDQAWQNVTQAACTCIDGVNPSDKYLAMYPYFQIAFNNSRIISTSTFIDYILVTDYTPATPPIGQLIGCVCPKPANNNALTSQQPFDNLFQAEAYSIGGGNSAFGGIIITIFLLFFFILLPSMAVYKATGHGPPGFILDFVMIAVVFLDYFVGILPIWITLISVILLASIGFGLVKSQFMVET